MKSRIEGKIEGRRLTPMNLRAPLAAGSFNTASQQSRWLCNFLVYETPICEFIAETLFDECYDMLSEFGSMIR